MNEVIKVKLVDLAAIELHEAATYPVRQSLDRHATYIVATFIAGASR